MAKSLPVGNPLGYLGIKEVNPPEVYHASRAPTVTDYRFDTGDIWIDDASNDIWMMSYKSGATATWIQVGHATGTLNTLTSDAGTALPVAGNINVVGGTNISTTAAGDTLTINFVGLTEISGSVSLATATNYSVPGAAAYGAATLFLSGGNDDTVPCAIVNLTKSSAAGTSSISFASEHAGNAGATYTVTWTAGTVTPTFQHDCGVAKTIYYKLIY